MNRGNIGSYVKKYGAVALLGIIALTGYFRLIYSSAYAGSWDQVDFSLALDRFDLLAMQPHFPGYPYFVLGGMVFHQWIDDPSQALAVFNTVMVFLAALPIYLLARRHLSSFDSLLTCTVVQSLSYLWIMSTESMSEATAISVLWWYLWGLQRAKENKTTNILLPLLLFSVLMGVRLSYIPFGSGIVLLILSKRKLFTLKKNFYIYTVKQLMFAAMFQVIWVFGLAATEGSLGNFLSLSLQFVDGHFNDWGGAVTADSTPLHERLFLLLFYNLFWVGLSGTSIYIAVLLGLLLILIGIDVIKNRKMHVATMVVYGLLIGSYFSWVLFAQNIDKPRHALPLIVLMAFVISIAVLKSQKQRAIKYFLIFFLVILQSINGYSYVKEKASSVPATYQLAHYLKDYDEPFVVYTWEEARIMDYLEVKFPYERILTYEYFISDTKQRKNKRIFITDHVLEGFMKQGVDIKVDFQEVKAFVSNPLFDPVYNKITLYEFKEK
jgi:hypothetical protein